MTTTLQSSDEVFPGYVLSDRLGSGGYAEVWRARAPGGIEKAIKFVYGYYDEELAAQEMKAMERIKDVRHPFLLSLERFEVVDGRLAILTELADMSLDQRARQYRAEGQAGIPRDELLRYMIDAAEALDFLSQKHGLQHLDIKPENLLVSGDHIKVADFGLVKELTTRTQNSLVAGMTPTYASPEMFDDTPSAHSDQYSLAIVYQEMLTGTLPFPGRTAAQLAKQHTQAEPQVMSLPVQDRPIVARALAKHPDQRYPSCRAFIEALKGGGVAAEPALPDPAVALTAKSSDDAINRTQPRGASPELVDDTQQTSLRTTQRHGIAPPVDVTQPINRVPGEPAGDTSPPADIVAEPLVVEEIVDVAVPDLAQLAADSEPTFYVGIGGVGIQTLCRLRDMLARQLDLDVAGDQIQMAALDTDRNELKEACSRRWRHPLIHEDTLHLPLRLPKSYDEDCRESLAWLSRRWLYNIPRSLETRGFRPLGRVALVDHRARVRALLEKRLARLVEGGFNENGPSARPVRAVILSGMGGGTGTGMLIDVANGIRALARARNAEIEVHGFLICTCVGQANASPLAAANTFALLTELAHASERGNLGTEGAQGVQKFFESPEPPFDAVYCVPARGRTTTSRPGSESSGVVRYLAAEATTVAGGVLRNCRQSPTERELAAPQRLHLRTLGFESLVDEKQQLLHRLADDLGRAIKQHWLADADGNGAPKGDDEASRARSPASSTTSSSGVVAELSSRGTSHGFSIAGMKSRFGTYATTQFACAVVSEIDRRLASGDERRNASLTVRQAQGIVAAIAPTLGPLATNVTQSSGDASQRAAPISGNEMREWVVEGSDRILRRLIDQTDQTPVDAARVVELIDGLIATECLELLESDLRQPSGSKAAAALANSTADIAHAIERASADLLKCGYDRRTLLFRPANAEDTSLDDKLKAVRPLAAIVTAETDDEIVICEGAGISPRSLARSLERLYPGIADAARRLCTRIDIKWQSLGE